MSANFEYKIKRYITRHNLLADGDKVIVGLSGGADSVALLAVLSALGYKCIAVHCNYHLRGPESDRDEKFASGTASRLGVQCHIGDFLPTGNGIEEQCRTMRYGLFRELSQRFGRAPIAVGHHREDNVETFLFNAMRGGASLRALKAMTPRRDDIIRPLLDVTRHEIEEYLRSKDLEWITDSSNLSDSYARNRIRNILMPTMRRCRADADTRLTATIDRLQDNYLLFKDYISELRSRYTSSSGVIDIARIRSEHPHPVQALYEILNNRDNDSDNRLSLTQIQNIVDTVGKNGPHYFRCSDGTSYVSEHGRLSLLHQPEEDLPFRASDGIPSLIEASIIDIGDFRPERDPYTLYIDADSEAANGIMTLRTYRTGDRMRPFGMNGSRLVSDICHDAGLSTGDRRQRRIVEYEGKILWIIGVRTSREFIVTSSTRRVLRLRATLTEADDCAQKHR